MKLLVGGLMGVNSFFKCSFYSQDIDKIISDGIFRLGPESTNTPDNIPLGSIVLSFRYDSNAVTHLYLPYNSRKMYKRSRDLSGWSPWKEFTFT